MRMHELLQSMDAEAKRDFAARAETHIVYLYQIAKGGRRPSPTFARRLVEVEPRLTLHELRPDIWDEAEQA